VGGAVLAGNDPNIVFGTPAEAFADRSPLITMSICDITSSYRIIGMRLTLAAASCA
jgi:hypothetical protein